MVFKEKMKRRSVSSIFKEKVLNWERQNLVHGAGYVDKNKGSSKSLKDNMGSRGYEVMRVSPQKTEKNGLKYRAVFGGQLEPNYGLSEKGKKYYPKVNWYKQGYVKDKGQKSGTFLITPAKDLKQTYTEEGLKQQLKLKKKK